MTQAKAIVTPPEPPPDESAHVGGAAPDTVMRTCPNCGAALAERKCKLYCPRPGCGYYLSCADYY